MTYRIVKWTLMVAAAIVAGFLPAAVLAPDRESRIQLLYPDCREYTVRLRAIGPEEWRHKPPETISLIVVIGKFDRGTAEEWPWPQYERNGSVSLWISPRDLICEEESGDVRKAAGTLNEQRLRTKLAGLGLSDEAIPSLGAELTELVALVREVGGQGSWRMMYPADKGARGAGVLQHFDSYGDGALKIYSGGSAQSMARRWVAWSAGFFLVGSGMLAVLAKLRRRRFGA